MRPASGALGLAAIVLDGGAGVGAHCVSDTRAIGPDVRSGDCGAVVSYDRKTGCARPPVNKLMAHWARFMISFLTMHTQQVM